MSFLRAQLLIDWIAVQPMTRSIMTMLQPQLPGELGALVHLLHGGGGDVEVVALDLAARGLRPVDRLHAVEEAVAPAS